MLRVMKKNGVPKKTHLKRGLNNHMTKNRSHFHELIAAETSSDQLITKGRLQYLTSFFIMTQLIKCHMKKTYFNIYDLFIQRRFADVAEPKDTSLPKVHQDGKVLKIIFLSNISVI